MNLPLNGRIVSAGIIALTLMLSALFLARGTTSLLAARLFPVQPIARPGGITQLEHLPGSELPDSAAILARNIFDPLTGPLPKAAETPSQEENAEQPAEVIDPNEPPAPCEGSMRLVAAVYTEDTPEWSFATLTTGSDKPLLYRIGGKIEEKDVVAIFPKAVYLRQSSGRLCSVQMFFDKAALARANTAAAARPALPTTPGVPPTPPPSTSPITPGGLSEAELDQNIKVISETKYQIPRTFVDKILKNQAQIMSAARIVPHEENGRMLGVKLYGIRRNSLLGKLGLQNGDLLRTINGFEMSSPDTALEAYARLRSANNLTVAIVRRGQPTNLDYDVQ